jgi:hypothetical protein
MTMNEGIFFALPVMDDMVGISRLRSPYSEGTQ